MRRACLSLSLASAEDVEGIYALLADDGQIFVPIQETFFATRLRCCAIGSVRRGCRCTSGPAEGRVGTQHQAGPARRPADGASGGPTISAP